MSELVSVVNEIQAAGTRIFEPYDMGPLPSDPFAKMVATEIATTFPNRVDLSTVNDAVVRLLCTCADVEGRITADAVFTKLGSRAAKVFTRVCNSKSPGIDLSTDSRISRGQLEDTTFYRDFLEETKQRTSSDMRALGAIVRRYGAKRPLSEMNVVGIQHLLGSTAELARALAASGVAPGNLLFVGKSYSQNMTQIDLMRNEGFVWRSTRPQDAKLSRADLTALVDNLQTTIRQNAKTIEHGSDGRTRIRGSKRVIVIDDGGELLKMINRSLPEEYLPYVVGVEQTTKGIRNLSGLKLKFPVVDVAGSWAKQTYESPLIGRSVGQSIEAHLGKLKKAGVKPGKRILIIGYGNIGRATASYLAAKGYAIDIYDTEETARKKASRDGFSTFSSLEEALANGHIVVGATGNTSVPSDKASLLPDGAILYSASSGNLEIAPQLTQSTLLDVDGSGTLRLSFRGKNVPIGEVGDSIRHDLVLSPASGKSVLLARRGFPINFNGGIDPIPPRYIQLTRGLLYLGAVQASKAVRPGIHRLRLESQRSLVRLIEKDLAELGESLSSPSF